MRIAFIGLGEAASALISGWGAPRAEKITAYDIKSGHPETAGEITDRALGLGVTASDRPATALADAELVFSAVTADQAVVAAEQYAKFLPPNALWCDLNSCAPSSKQKASAIIEGAGGRYLDVAVMAPVHPKLNMVPCLISGAAAEDLVPLLAKLPMNVRVVGEEVGRASSIKMVRSIMVKGLEALTAECTLAAVAAGVADDVFPSLKSGHPHIDVPDRAAYNFERSLVHGQRRAAEMDEVAKMLSDLGLPNVMAMATSEWQSRLGTMGREMLSSNDASSHLWYASEILKVFGIDAPD